MALGGTVVRPEGSDDYFPPEGTRVTWRAHGIIQRMYDQAKAHGVEVKGVIGNTDHLRKHGGHTPWEPDKPLGVVHAIDLEAPGLGDFILAICRTNEDTSFIQFMNWRGRQYDYGGNDIGSSGDQHLHFHVKAGREGLAVDLINRYANRNQPPPPEEDDDMKATDTMVLTIIGEDGAPQVYPGVKYEGYLSLRYQQEMQKLALLRGDRDAEAVEAARSEALLAELVANTEPEPAS